MGKEQKLILLMVIILETKVVLGTEIYSKPRKEIISTD